MGNCLLRIFENRSLCRDNGHSGYEQIIIRPYEAGDSSVNVECSNCGGIYDRVPSSEEVRDYLGDVQGVLVSD